jgi:GMP synthase-like glutamine amidotransferase
VKIHYLQHVPFEGPGAIAEWARTRDHALTGTCVYQESLLHDIATLDWLIVLGGPMNIYEEAVHPWLVQEKRFIKSAVDAGKRVLGICLGAQLIAHVLGARVNLDACREIGWYPVGLTDAGRRAPALAGLAATFDAYHWHSDTFEIPSAAVHAASSHACCNQAFIYQERVVGLQFHLETTRQGADLLIEHCGTPDSPEARAMVADPARFHALRDPLWHLLDNMSKL